MLLFLTVQTWFVTIMLWEVFESVFPRDCAKSQILTFQNCQNPEFRTNFGEKNFPISRTEK